MVGKGALGPSTRHINSQPYPLSPSRLECQNVSRNRKKSTEIYDLQEYPSGHPHPPTPTHPPTRPLTCHRYKNEGGGEHRVFRNPDIGYWGLEPKKMALAHLAYMRAARHLSCVICWSSTLRGTALAPGLSKRCELYRGHSAHGEISKQRVGGRTRGAATVHSSPGGQPASAAHIKAAAEAAWLHRCGGVGGQANSGSRGLDWC